MDQPPPDATPDAGLPSSSLPNAPNGSEYPPEPTRPPPTPLECPDCFSHRAQILDCKPARARCCDCGTAYPLKLAKPLPHEFNQLDEEQDEEEAGQQQKKSSKRKSKADWRAEIVPAPDPAKPFATAAVDSLIAAGPDELVRATHEAARLSVQFGERFEAKWFLMTDYLQQLKSTNRARARYALEWRPRFLAGLAMTRSQVAACRHAKVSENTAIKHRKEDKDFESQCCAAEAHAVQLIHDRAFQRAVEGDCEPIVYAGVVVGHVRKFDSRLQTEFLRAYMPERFKTPGQNQVTVNTGDTNVLVLTAEDREKIMAARQAHLLTMPGAEERQPVSPAG